MGVVAGSGWRQNETLAATIAPQDRADSRPTLVARYGLPLSQSTAITSCVVIALPQPIWRSRSESIIDDERRT